MKFILIFTVSFFLITVSSCFDYSNVKGIAVPKADSVVLPDKIKINVVHISQLDKKSCATTSAAMAISHYKGLDDKPLDKEAVWKISETDEKTVRTLGNDMKGLERIANYYGFKSEYVEYLTFFDLEFLLSKGILVLINIRVYKSEYTTHAVLVTGYDRTKEVFYVNDPADNGLYSGGYELIYSDLDSRWSAYLSSPRGMSYRSGFIIYPKTEIK